MLIVEEVKIMSLVSNLLDKFGIKASLAQADDFEKWLINAAWSKYNEDKMNNRIVVENKVKALSGLRFSNGTVRKDYLSQIELPTDLVMDAWFEGLPAGLDWTLEEYPAHEENINPIDENQKETSVQVNADNQAETEIAEFHQPEKLILKVFGKPTQPGDYIVNLVYRHNGWMDGDECTTIGLPIAFNPDPRSLWKTIPTPTSIPFYKPDYEVDYVKVSKTNETGPRKDIVAASQRGRSHAQEGKARDDHFKLFHCDTSDWYIIAVADGAGSAKFSRQGSKIACDPVVDFCREKLQNSESFEQKIRAYHNAENEETARKIVSDDVYGIVGNAAFKAHKEINEVAKITAKEVEGTRTKDFATTLLLAICKKFDFGWFIASYWVGDGAMCLFNTEKQSHKILGIPDEGEYSGQTRFLTMPEIFKDGKAIMDRLRFSIEDDFTSLMLMTDGVSDPMFETENNLNSYDKWVDFWNKIKNGFPEDEIPGVDLSDDNEESKYQLLHWLDFWSAGNHDDRTIAILY